MIRACDESLPTKHTKSHESMTQILLHWYASCVSWAAFLRDISVIRGSRSLISVNSCRLVVGCFCASARSNPRTADARCELEVE